MLLRTRRRGVLFALTLWTCSVWLQQNAFAQILPEGWKLPKPDFKTPTMGGQQVWSDVRFCGDWHIQRNMLTGNCRLLDGRHWQHASGDFEECLAKLEAFQREGKNPTLKPTSRKCVVVLHGLVRSHRAMDQLCEFLREEGGFYTVNVTYASTQAQIGVFAKQLDSIIRHLDGVDEIHFVAHSMGNIVIRRYLGDQLAAQRTAKPDAEPQVDPRIKRMVMLAPPNHGSCRAEAWSENVLFQKLLGPGARELGDHWPELAPTLATPPFEFGVLAGGKGTPNGWLDSIAGDDDGTISVATTRLAGARDFHLQPILHTFIVNHRDSMACTLRFLRHGHFISSTARQPIAP